MSSSDEEPSVEDMEVKSTEQDPGNEEGNMSVTDGETQEVSSTAEKALPKKPVSAYFMFLAENRCM